MTPFEDEPLSPLDEEIEMLLQRLAALQESVPEKNREAIHAVAIRAITERLRELSRKCTDSTCRIRVYRAAREFLGEGEASPKPGHS